MTPLWLLITPGQMATVAAGAYFLGSLVVTAFAVEFVNHHSTVDRSSPEESPATSGEGRWIVGASEQEWAAPSCAGHAPAVQTKRAFRPARPTESVGVGDPTPR